MTVDNNHHVELATLASSYFGKIYKATETFHAGMELINKNQMLMVVVLSSKISKSSFGGLTFGILLLSGNHLYCYYTYMDLGDCKLYFPKCLELVE